MVGSVLKNEQSMRALFTNKAMVKNVAKLLLLYFVGAVRTSPIATFTNSSMTK